MTKLIRLSIVFIVLASSQMAVSAPLICEWKNVKMTESVSAETLKSYYEKLKAECDYTLEMSKVASKLASVKRPIENLNYYQGLRYVDLYSYEKARKENVPLNVVYQIKKEDYSVPVAQRSHLVWDNWTAGINTLPAVKNNLLAGQPFTLEMLMNIHKSFYTADESGEYGKVFSPGTLKPSNTPEISWALKEKIDETAANVNSINQFYVQLGLQPEAIVSNFDDYQTPDNKFQYSKVDTSFVQILAVKDGDLKPSHPAYIQAHMQQLERFVTYMIQKARVGRALTFNGHLFTPLEFALFVQQTLVRIHGFYDGNGRTSRYMQDLILALFDMPFISSGNIQANDMTSVLADYYKQAADSNLFQIQQLNSCTDKNNQNFDCQSIN
jgi:prophage maintenance system killer protein